jgi:hypothetical protein
LRDAAAIRSSLPSALSLFWAIRRLLSPLESMKGTPVRSTKTGPSVVAAAATMASVIWWAFPKWSSPVATTTGPSCLASM